MQALLETRNENAILRYFKDEGPLRRELYPKHVNFFAAGNKYRIRCFMAANRIGKTIEGAYETSVHLTGAYPKWWEGRRFVGQIRAWAAGRTNETTRDIVQRTLLGDVTTVNGHKTFTGTGVIPKKLIGKRITWKQGVTDLADTVEVYNLKEGKYSILGFKSYQQGRGSFEGTAQHVIWLDEEPPMDVYGECIIRTATVDGLVLLTFTPLEGMSNVALTFLPNGAIPVEPGPVTSFSYIVMAGWSDVPHLSEHAKRELLEATPPFLRDARSKGIPVMGEGRVFLIDEEAIKVQSFPIPSHWPRIAGLDVGWDHPTVAIWIAWDRDSDILYLYDEEVAFGKTPHEIAPSILTRGDWIPVAWPADTLQREKGTGFPVAELYRIEGVKMLHEMAQFAERGDDGETRLSRVSVEAGVYDMLQRMQTGRLKVFPGLIRWWSEFRVYHRKDGVIVKLIDDAISASRYAIMMLRYARTPDRTAKALSPTRKTVW